MVPVVEISETALDTVLMGCTARAVRIVMLALVGFTATCANSAAQQATTGLDRAVRDFWQRGFPKQACERTQRFSLGLWTIADDKSPLSTAVNKRIYQSLFSSLLTFKPKCADLIDNAGISIIVEHLAKSGSVDANGGNALAAMAELHQSVDYIIMPDVYSQANDVFTTLRMVERSTGKTMSLATSIPVAKSLLKDELGDKAVTLPEAMKAASTTLLSNAPDLRELQSAGVFFEATEAQTPAGQYLQEQLLGALIEGGSNPLTNKAVRTRAISIEPRDQETSQASELDAQAIARAADVYHLSGRYWVRGSVIDLKFALRRPDGVTAAWSGRINAKEMDGLRLTPLNPASKGMALPKQNYSFQVTSPRGSSPTYIAGEELQILIRSDRNAWVYCFYVDSKGGVQPILPLPTLTAGLSTRASNQIAAKRINRFPDPDQDRLVLRFNSDTVGEELVSCFSALRDIRGSLPSTLFPNRLEAIPFLTLHKVRDLFSAVPNAQVAESVINISVSR